MSLWMFAMIVMLLANVARYAMRRDEVEKERKMVWLR